MSRSMIGLMQYSLKLLIIFASAALAACTTASKPMNQAASERPAEPPLPPITVPEGFQATVFADRLGATRHIAVRDNGDVYVAREFRIERKMFGQEAEWGALIALRDENGDGVADRIETFGPTDVDDEVRIHKGYLYFSSDQVVYRMALDDNLVPQTVAEPLAGGFPMTACLLYTSPSPRD